MRGRFAHRFVLAVLLICPSPCLAAESSDPNDSSKYLDAVREFADNVLKYGRDTYGPKHTPLFVDGLNIHTHEPVKWIAPNGDRWILSNLASQQNLFRTLDGLSTITGDPKYKQAAMDAIKYAFENLRSPNGLLYWGHATAYDAMADDLCGFKNKHHTFKLHYPYYELMWEVDSEITSTFIESFWSAHVIDWSNLNINRAGWYDEVLEEPWNHEYKGEPIFFGKDSGPIGIFLTGSSLVQAGTVFYELSGKRQPLVWNKRLVKHFIDTRHPNTGISAFLYNVQKRIPWFRLGEDMKDHFLDPYTTTFPSDYYKYRYLYYPENTQAHPWLGIFLVGRMLGVEGREFTRWALEELTAWGRVSYRKRDNSFVPMLTDGTSLEGYVWEEGPGRGTGENVIEPYPADLSFFWAYSTAYCATGDEFMWEMDRDIALGNGFGDIGQTPAHVSKLQINTICSHAYGIFGFLELYAKTKKSVYLEMAQRIGDNILMNKFNKGFFTESKRHLYARFGCFEALALLHLYATMRSEVEVVPCVWPEVPLFVPPYRHKREGVDRHVIYSLTESPEPPLSLQETATIGDANLLRVIIDNGVHVDSLEDSFYKTALHCAATEGHKAIIALLLASEADVNARDAYLASPLHYAVERGHEKIAELLIAKGSDVNAKNLDGQISLHYAVERGLEDIVELLIAKGADMDAKNRWNRTPLDLAVAGGHTEIVELLRRHGAKEDKLPQSTPK